MAVTPARRPPPLGGSLDPLKGLARRPRTSVTDEAINSIRRMILTGELAAGDRLPPEADLAASLGLSRTSLREAVRALTVLGVMVTRQGDASYISSLGPELLLGALGLAVDLQREDTMPDLVAVRRILEPAAAGLAAKLITAPDLATLQANVDSADGGNARQQVEVDRQFHRIIALASGNELLVALLDGLAEPSMRMRIWRGMSVPRALERTRIEHQQILDALRAGDAALAFAAATVHVAGVQSWLGSLEPGWSARAARDMKVPED